MEKEVVIRVNHVNKSFRLPHDKATSVKSTLVNMLKGRRGYEIQHALQNVSFVVHKGDFFGIVGRNGSGKSTLLKLLAGIYTPNEGSVGVNGKLVPFIELGVGFNIELTGRENVYLNGALLGFSQKEMEAMYDEIVEFAELERFMDQKLKNYSSGMQVRLAFSIAIRAQSDILLLDEVLAVGDAAFQQKCYDYFEKLKRDKKSVVFVSHDMGAVRRFCNRAVYIKDGKVILEGSPSDIADLYVENNIDTGNNTENKLELPEGYKVSVKKISEDDDSLKLRFSYRAKQDERMYIGISIVMDSVSIAEITTSQSDPVTGNGAVVYTLDKSLFNGGMYKVAGITLFRLDNREVVAISKSTVPFAVKSADITKGGALKLPANWEYDAKD